MIYLGLSEYSIILRILLYTFYTCKTRDAVEVFSTKPVSLKTLIPRESVFQKFKKKKNHKNQEELLRLEYVIFS